MEDNMETQETVGAWFNKNDWRDMKLIFDPNEPPPESYVRAQPLDGVMYQQYDEATGEWAADSNSETLEKIDACKEELAAIDREAGAGRAVRAIALEAAEKAGIKNGDFDRLQEYENRAAALRETIEQLRIHL
jgi:hypothetical protein